MKIIIDLNRKEKREIKTKVEKWKEYTFEKGVKNYSKNKSALELAALERKYGKVTRIREVNVIVPERNKSI